MLLALTGCKKNDSTETSTFTASIETDDSGSKTSLNDKKVYWSTGDQITVYNHNSSHDYTLQGNGPTQLGTFTTTGGVQPTETNYWGFYPAGGCSNRNDDVFTFSMTSPTQTYNSTGFAEGVNPMVGKNTDSDHPTRLYFKNAFSILKIKATGNNRPITSIELTTTGTNYLTGIYTYDYANGTTNFVSGSTGGNIITLTGISETLDATEKAFHIVVPPHALEGGFTVTFKNNTSTVKSFTVSASDMGNYATQHLLNPNTIFEASVNVNVQVPQVTNLLPEVTSSNWNTWNISGNATFHSASNTYENNNFSKTCFINSDASKSEGGYQTIAPVHLINGHTYYVRWCMKYTGTKTYSVYELFFLGSTNINWVTAATVGNNGGNVTYIHINKNMWWKQPGTTLGIPTDPNNNNQVLTNQWHMYSMYKQFEGATGDYYIRLDVNNGSKAATNEMAAPMLVDLTADFAGTTIPPFQECDNNVYFSGTHDRDTW